MDKQIEEFLIEANREFAHKLKKSVQLAEIANKYFIPAHIQITLKNILAHTTYLENASKKHNQLSFHQLINNFTRNLNNEKKKMEDNLAKWHQKKEDILKVMEELIITRKSVELKQNQYQNLLKDNQKMMVNINNIQISLEELIKKEEYSKKKIKELSILNEEKKKKIEQLWVAKRKLNNQLQELKGNIRVYCRIRPALNKENQNQIMPIQISYESTIKFECPQVKSSDNYQKSHVFNFEHIFCQSSKQQDLFNQLAQLIQSSIDGKCVCIFAYGQTGSGKTYTMQGGQGQHRGLIPRGVEFIFNQLNKSAQYGYNYKVLCSIQQVYMQTIRDLLNLQNRKQEANQFDVKSLYDILKYIKIAQNNRSVAATNCNQHSSRSHCIFTIKLFIQNCKDKRQGALVFIDLAGSERLDQSKVEGQRLKQTMSINKSLTNLSQVITALAKKDNHIPYRNSKLTYLLQHIYQENLKHQCQQIYLLLNKIIVPLYVLYVLLLRQKKCVEILVLQRNDSLY